ncbi:dihydroxyacetone kinase subunit L [Exilibacterium tricleocarpae]|uniref:Dihydroxyacetone kinase subunit L n=1 Tax=Exilibacterium tricleocarpae TaxID=2591008 RepID=A0A545TLS6_9GAMM|nr:dihydroxyacetone kinase subunit DhaL [Exilibacterium tricleocarpae]TQV78197.1 dihydroxyacetone kinase subunit L [Exilibacterium tricleocarpae]
MNTTTLDDVALVVKTMAVTALENEKYFSELDAAAGDADFGVSLAAGFQVVNDDWEQLDRSSIGNFLLKISMIITGKVGGCSGPIWGTGFMKAGLLSKDKETLQIADLVAMLRAGIDGIMARGGAKAGDKTLLDALIPMTDKLEEFVDTPTAAAQIRQTLTAVAEQAIETTSAWEAKRGRQSFTGARSIGTPDPGIVAIATMMRAINNTFDGAARR